MRAPLFAAAMLLAGVTSLVAQRVTLTITGGGAGTFPNPTVANYVAGFVDSATPITYSLTTNNWGGGAATATVTVEVCAVNANLTNGKLLTDLKWRPGDLSKPFVSMVQGCTAPIQSGRTVVVHQMAKNTTWAAGPSILLEMALTWAGDTQASYGTPIQLMVSVVTP